jgi:cephalosporin hydroxylase
MNPDETFREQVSANVERLGAEPGMWPSSLAWMLAAAVGNYSYNFRWMGRPIIQYPQDMVAVQELIWAIKPDLIVETGIAHGGSLVLSASMLALLDYCEAAEKGESLRPRESRRRVLGVDIDIRAHNRAALEAHPLAHLIEMVEGSSIAPEIIDSVRRRAAGAERVLVMLDSNHTHDHVLEELRAYAPLVSRDSYCVVFDTVVEETPAAYIGERPWGPGNSPMTAVRAYLAELGEDGPTSAPGAPRFEVDVRMHDRLQITVAKGGFLKRTR